MRARREGTELGFAVARNADVESRRQPSGSESSDDTITPTLTGSATSLLAGVVRPAMSGKAVDK